MVRMALHPVPLRHVFFLNRGRKPKALRTDSSFMTKADYLSVPRLCP